MDRRGVLAALPPLLAGCFGGGAVSRRRTDATPNGTETTTARPTGTATRTETATPESESTSSAAEQKAARYVRTARDRIRTAVEGYADSGDLTDVHADADRFVPGTVHAALVRANSAASHAAALAATDEQRTTATRLKGVVAFLTRATTAQANVIEGYDGLVTIREALDDEESSEVDRRLDDVDTARENAERALSHLTTDTDAADTEAVEVVGTDDYRAKRAQFKAATTALDDAAEEASSFADGIDLLSAARTRGENGNADAAVEDATEAKDRLETVASAFGSLADDLPSEASVFEDLFGSFEDLADEKASAAGDVKSEYE